MTFGDDVGSRSKRSETASNDDRNLLLMSGLNPMTGDETEDITVAQVDTEPWDKDNTIVVEDSEPWDRDITIVMDDDNDPWDKDNTIISEDSEPWDKDITIVTLDQMETYHYGFRQDED